MHVHCNPKHFTTSVLRIGELCYFHGHITREATTQTVTSVVIKKVEGCRDDSVKSVVIHFELIFLPLLYLMIWSVVYIKPIITHCGWCRKETPETSQLLAHAEQ